MQDDERKVLPSIEEAMQHLLDLSEDADAFDRTQDNISRRKLSKKISDTIFILKQALTKI